MSVFGGKMNFTYVNGFIAFYNENVFPIERTGG